jgi:hypothetical protein|tara:strand:+ start:1222 stop:1446 length:225 start_codon:yes stop_codon:yes gene_type:complete
VKKGARVKWTFGNATVYGTFQSVKGTGKYSVKGPKGTVTRQGKPGDPVVLLKHGKQSVLKLRSQISAAPAAKKK